MTDELDELFSSEEPEVETPTPAPTESMTQEDEEQLRRIAARVSSSHEEMDDGGSGYSWRGFSPAQRLILAILVLLNIIVISFGVLVVGGYINL
ncbi:MAG: hypothetical protein AAF614_17100 [Chloroflexota bacterium]